MGHTKYCLLFALLAALLNDVTSNACQMEGIGNWGLVPEPRILDTHRGVVFSRTTTNIQENIVVNTGDGVNALLYLDISMQGSNFVITTTSAFELYEENETATSMGFSVIFLCASGSTNTLVFEVHVDDTNNNPPTFRPSNEFEFIITPPLPPGFQITGCGDDIIVRDIDLTTQQIDFELQDNPYFEIAYNGRSSIDPKEFLAVLRTKDLIRALPEVVELTVSATDVDNTGDPPLTTTATIRIQADDQYQFPDEPVFSQPFYTATYTNANQLIILETILLQQGFDEEVTFTLEGDHSDYFTLSANGNQIYISVKNPLSTEILRTGQVILVVRAERVHTTGATTTVIVQLPEVPGLEFEQTHYEGRIIDNVLQSIQLKLVQGYEEGFNVSLYNEYASFFVTSVQGNIISLSMSPLSSTIVDLNNFITLQVIVSNDYSSTSAILTLEIIKDDNVTPVFENAIYPGNYNPETGLSIYKISLIQGYDEDVLFSLQGEHVDYFQISNDGPVVTLTSSAIPPELWIEQQLLLTLVATKQRSVAATAAISIKLPSARELLFETTTYRGTIQNDIITLQPIILTVGYSEDVNFILSGDFSNYFTLSSVQNQVTINLPTSLPNDVILENNFLILTLRASGLHTIPASTAVVLEIIKQDVTTPVFTENIYRATFSGTNAIEIGNMGLAQGYDNTVTFDLEGEHAQFFRIINDGNNLNLEIQSDIPAEIIFQDKVLLFNVLAHKPLTVGANAAIAVAFPLELTDATVIRFSQNTYVGFVKENILTLEDIVIETGYESGTNFSLTGEHASYFSIENIGNTVTISITSTLPDELMENDSFIILEVEASRERAVSASVSIVIDIIEEEIISPVFSAAFYRGVYADNEFHFEDDISLSLGYDDTVIFTLEGEHAAWFEIIQNGNSVTLTLKNSNTIPETILENNNQLLFTIVAIKHETNNGKAAISIDLPEEIPEPVIMRFTQSSYVGRIDNGELYASAITLLGDKDPVQLKLTGDYSSYFELSHVANDVKILLINELPEYVIDELAFLILDIEASYPEAIKGYTTIVLEIIKQPQIFTPAFEKAYYIGEYSNQGGLQLEQSIRLIQGFDESVLFTLAGDDAQWFELVYNDENYLTLSVSDSALGQIRDRGHIIFSVLASKPNSIAGHTAVVINLTDLTTSISLRFSQNLYTGTIENTILTISDINLVEGYSPDITVSFTGDHVEYIQLTDQEGVFTLHLISDLPPDIIRDNNVLVFTLEVHIGGTTAHTTVILELIKTEPSPLAFEEAYYVGSYSLISGFAFDPQITITEHDDTVSFTLEGDDSQWFGIMENQYPLKITQVNPIPVDVLSTNQQLIFVIVAERPEKVTSRSTIIITIIDDTAALGFERNIYLGSIQNHTTDIDTIVLSDGYSANVLFTLLGELQSYFSINEVQGEGTSITIELQNTIPEELIPANRIILLELQASAPQTISAYATIVFGIVEDDIEQLIFNAPYYTGNYTITQGLEFLNAITLSHGYNENVQFTLEGESASYFRAVVTENSVTLELVNPIPQPIVTTNQQLIFTILAVSPKALTARSTIVISLIDDVTEDVILGFDQIAYLGSIEDNTVNLHQITLSVGYSQNVFFTLYGDLERFFNIISLEGTVTISLPSPIPNEYIPDNGIIILELHAAALDAMSAYATIVLHIVEEVIELPVFDQTYYIGHYTQIEGLTFERPMTLSEGYDENVQFTLEGESSQYFEAVTSGNSVLIQVITPIPTTTVLNNQHLTFTIRADKPEDVTTRATIIISLLDVNLDDLVLKFNQISYQGLIENNFVTMNQITLIEGFSQGVSFTLHGDLTTYFKLIHEEASLTITLENPIPEEFIPDNGIIVLELQASANQMVSTYATVVLSVVQKIIEPLLFSNTYYTGHYEEIDGLTFENTITLVEGYDENVIFTLEGDGSQYFEPNVLGNSVSLKLISAIPPAIAISNQHLIFEIHAYKPNAELVQAAIIISLLDVAADIVLKFDQITYLGSIESGTSNLERNIILSDGYSQDVSFTLFGHLADYFGLVTSEETVTISLKTQIPEELIPDNRIILLELHATAPEAISAFATIVYNVIEEDTEIVERLTFSETYYTGHYTLSIGLIFEEKIILSGGYDENVQFKLEGDSAQYFETLVSGNSVSLRVISAIPVAVVSNNQQLIFTIRADRTGAITTRAAIVITLLDEFTENLILGFDKTTYAGSLYNNIVNLDPMTLSEGNTQNVMFVLYGDLESYFNIENSEATVLIQLQKPIPAESMPNNHIILLEIQATAPNTIPAHAAIVLEVIQNETSPNIDLLEFSETYYAGYHIGGTLTFEDTITLIEGYDENVKFKLEGDSSQYFEAIIISSNTLSLVLITPIPSAIVSNNQQLIFTIHAERLGAVSARATIVISLADEPTENIILGFDRITYVGTISNNTANINSITLSEGYTPNVLFILFGDLGSYFSVSNVESSVTISLLNPIPEEMLPDNRIIILELQASATDTTSAHAAIVFEVIQEDMTPNLDQLIFSETYYSGYYKEAVGLIFKDTITLTDGYDENVLFVLEGDSAQYFEAIVSSNLVSLRLVTPVPPAVVSNNQQLIFTIRAERDGAFTSRATIIIALVDEHTEDPILGFSQISYTGSIENDVANIEPIVLSEGYSEAVNFALHGDFAEYFTKAIDGPIVTIALVNVIPEQSLPTNRIILLNIQAFVPDTMSAYATIVFEVVQKSVEDIVFNRPFYTGQYIENGELSFEDQITLTQGYEETVVFSLEGDHAQWFVLEQSENSLSITLYSPISQDVLENNRKLILVLNAQKPNSTPRRATVIISLFKGNQDCTPDDGARFEKLIFEGQIQGGVVQHETISLSGYDGTNIQILGKYAELFEPVFDDGVVKVRGVGSVILSPDVPFVTLELQAGSASAVLLLQTIHSEDPSLPLVTFSASSYIVRVEISQIGFIGRVQATADNGETIAYSIAVDNAHLLQRVSINSKGELHLSAPVNTGVYAFDVIGTTSFSQATGTATVHLAVEAITVCGENNLVLPPLMTLDRDEESPHENLVVLNTSQFAGCRYQLTNRWPIDQSWLYVDENGLHATAIDREHDSIAFMALSQVQVELILECDNDVTTRAKRSVSTATRLNHLGPYDYGDNKWILTDTILYNPRRTLVNLIVNDINDNVPIFNGKENEPIVVGYPIADLEERILPRALAEVQATDADVGLNAALVYWSSEDMLAVSPHSGFVHVRNNDQLENNMILTISATDRNGQGLTGSLDLMVKLVGTNHIAVVTVRQAFLDDERTVLANLSSAVGYEVKALRSTVVSDSDARDQQRKKRQAVMSTEASLQLYVYGLIERDPVDVQQLTEDIIASDITAGNIASTVSLEDYLESLEICSLPGHDTALLVSTIVLSVLLFILIVVAAVWFFLRWRRKQKYEQFRDDSSIETQNETPSTRPKPVENVQRSRMNLEDLKKSERKLQDMLEGPIEEIKIGQSALTISQKPPEAKLSILEPPIVISSIDKLKDVDDSEDEDEFGEKARGKRKSVVTFNENVEKIIHVEDTPDDSAYEVYKL